MMCCSMITTFVLCIIFLKMGPIMSFEPYVTAHTGFPGINDWPYRSPQALTKCFVLTRILPPKTSQEVTHLRTTPSQAHLTWKFLWMSYRKGRCTFGDIS